MISTLVQVGLAIAALATCVAIQTIGVTILLNVLDWAERRFANLTGRAIGLTMMGVLVCCLFVLHLAEIALYALFYFVSGAVRPFDTALYLSAVTFATVGYGDIEMEEGWRLFAAFEGMSGIILAGWSVAILVEVISTINPSERLK